jgi:nucleotide-binding universal stress UspA family protein
VQVGRGNRANGLMAFSRPTGGEAAAGKNSRNVRFGGDATVRSKLLVCFRRNPRNLRFPSGTSDAPPELRASVLDRETWPLGGSGMAKRILLPLDRIEDAEVVLGLVGEAARAGGAVVRLLHVAPVPESVVTPEGRVLAYADQETERVQQRHLERLQMAQHQFTGVVSECVVRFGDPTAEILAEADVFDADLIAVMTRCRSGVSRALLGSVAEQVLSRARPAVMVVRPAA